MAGPTEREEEDVEPTHDTGTIAIIVLFAAVVGLLAGWLAADFGIRGPAYAVGAAGSGYLLFQQPSRRAVLAAGLYSVAAMVAVAPMVYELGVVATVDAPLRHVLGASDLLVLLVFWLVAAVPAIVGYRLTSGPFLPRVRALIG
jgi:hypothetical protein